MISQFYSAFRKDVSTCLRTYSTASFLFFFSFMANAEGSKDLHPNGATGYRAYLLATSTTAHFNPFPTSGTVKVYVNSGETIYMGSSMQGKNLSNTYGKIELRSPSGVLYASANGSNTGLIANRAQELAGPNRTGVTNGYMPFTQVANETGIWEVRFIAVGTGTNIQAAYNYTANENWIQDVSSGSSALIAAWDVSVGDGTSVLKTGRAFVTAFAGTAKNSAFTELSFYGKFYVLTPSGYAYLVDANGLNGASFNFFSNNKGVMNVDGSPAYKSYAYSRTTGASNYFTSITSKIWDPMLPDANGNFTNKLFFAKPNIDLPTTAKAWYGGATGSNADTWLRKTAVAPVASSLDLTCGGQIKFMSNVSGTYKMVIDIGNNNSFEDAVDRVFTGNTIANVLSSVIWDGKDGNGTDVALGTSIRVRAYVTTAEVHFPFADAESNKNGVIIKLLDASYNEVAGKDIVYWDDAEAKQVSDIGLAPNRITEVVGGVSSILNGHKWSGTSDLESTCFGNDKLLDTWSYVETNFTFSPETYCLSLSGSVFPDRDKGTDIGLNNTYSKDGKTFVDGYEKLPAGLFATLIDISTGKVLQSIPVISGNYQFSNLTSNKNYTVSIGTTQYSNTTQASSVVATLPAGWMFTRSNINNTVNQNNISGSVPVALGTNFIRDANFGIYSAIALPVHFGTVSAKYTTDGLLQVNWQALSEANNSYYEIEASVDGKKFTTIGKVDSQAIGGNSSVALDYSFTTTGQSALGLLGISVLMMGGLLFSLNKRNKGLLIVAVILATGFLGASCKKQEVDLSKKFDKLFIRIKQVDINGDFEYSKLIKVNE